MKHAALQNFVAGAPAGCDAEMLDVLSPIDGSTLSRVPLSSAATLETAVAAAVAAYPAWGSLTLRERALVFHRYRALLERHLGELASLIHEENGKTLDEAAAEVHKAIEVTEFACALPHLAAGEVLEVSRGVECRTERAPLGVVACVTPFNFPCMVPHWTIPIALTLGNTLILKPSEQVPLTASRTAELLAEAGLPAGAFNVVHGDRRVVEAICDHPAIRAVTFVGSTPAAKSVYVRATGNLKRALCLGGAKNHLVVLPDADPDLTAVNVTASFAGCAGQRCMAASAMLAVGEVDAIIARLCEEARRMTPGRNLGAVITRVAKERIERAIDEAERDGATVLVDGRRPVVPGCEGGFYVGPTILDHVRPDMRIAHDEIFGPVLAILRVKDVDEAAAIENRSPFGNAAAVYTRNGKLAREIVARMSAGMVGVNVGVPVPREPFGFGGWNDSRFGVGDITGKSSIEFWTQSKKVTTRWTGDA